MSKRYGRNQRRKQRERIAKLEEAYNRELGLVKWQGDKLAEAKETIDDMIQAIESVCYYSSTIPPKEVKGSYDPEEYRIPYKTPLEYNRDEGVRICKVSDTVVNTYAMRAYIQDHHADFGKSVHLVYKGKHQAYMLSESALMTMSPKEIRKYVMPDIFNDLICAIKKSMAA